MQQRQRAMDARVRLEPRQRFVDAGAQHLGDAHVQVPDLQRLGREALPAAGVARHPYVRQEAHLDPLHALALAGVAPPARDVEREAARAVAADA